MAKEIVYDIPERSLPQAMLHSESFMDLNDEQKFNFSGRLRFIEQIVLEISEWVNATEPDLVAFLERIELHLAINQGAPQNNPDKYISSWFIHTSWIYDIKKDDIYSKLNDMVLDELNRKIPTTTADLYEFSAWIEQQNIGLKKSLDDFYASSTYESSIANYLAIDALLANLFCGVTKVNLNPNFPKSK